MVEQVSPGVWKVCLVAISLASPEPATTFIDVLKGWGHTWLWDKLKVTGGTSWIANAIVKGMLVAVADGSNIRKNTLICARQHLSWSARGIGGC